MFAPRGDIFYPRNSACFEKNGLFSTATGVAFINPVASDMGCFYNIESALGSVRYLSLALFRKRAL